VQHRTGSGQRALGSIGLRILFHFQHHVQGSQVIETSCEAFAPGIDVIAQGRGDFDLVTADLNLHDWLLKHQGVMEARFFAGFGAGSGAGCERFRFYSFVIVGGRESCMNVLS
jgi:hypothetical protein